MKNDFSEREKYMRIKDILRLIKHSYHTNKKLFVVILFKSFFMAFSSLFLVIGLGSIVEKLINREEFSSIIKTILFYSFIPLTINMITSTLNFYINYLIRMISNDIQYQYVDNALNINYHYVQDGQILNLKRKSMNGHSVFYVEKLGDLVQQIFQIFGIIFIFAFMTPLFIVIIITIQIIIVYLNNLKRNLTFKFNNDIVDSNRKLDYIYNIMTDYRYGKDIRVNKGEKLIVDKAIKNCNDYYSITNNYYKKSYFIEYIYEIVKIFMQLFMYGFFTYQFYLQNINISKYTVLISSTFLFSTCIDYLSNNYLKILDGLKYETLLNEYNDEIKKKSDISHTNNLQNINIDQNNLTLSFVNVSFAYPESNVEVLKNINIKINANEKIGLIGLNGAGKTTLIKLILRLYTPTKGKILLNDIDINQIPLKQYLSMIGVVLQDYFIFAYSIKENIIFNNKLEEDKLINCLAESGLNDKIKNLPYGIETILYKELCDEGIELSGGENQKLAISRAIYKSAKILIMDEPTSTLDPLAEYNIFSRFKSITNDKLAILISHRLSFTALCSKIYVLDKGIIIESGTHNELMMNKKKYYDLYITQINYYEDIKK